MASAVGRIITVRTVFLILGLVFGVCTLVLVRQAPEHSFSGGSWPGRVAELAVGWALAGAGFAAARRHPAASFGPALTAAGFAWFLLEWNNPGVGSAIVFTVGLVTYAGCAPLVAYAVSRTGGPALRSRSVGRGNLFAGAFIGLGWFRPC